MIELIYQPNTHTVTSAYPFLLDAIYMHFPLPTNTPEEMEKLRNSEEAKAGVALGTPLKPASQSMNALMCTITATHGQPQMPTPSSPTVVYTPQLMAPTFTAVVRDWGLAQVQGP